MSIFTKQFAINYNIVIDLKAMYYSENRLLFSHLVQDKSFNLSSKKPTNNRFYFYQKIKQNSKFCFSTSPFFIFFLKKAAQNSKITISQNSFFKKMKER